MEEELYPADFLDGEEMVWLVMGIIVFLVVGLVVGLVVVGCWGVMEVCESVLGYIQRRQGEGLEGRVV